MDEQQQKNYDAWGYLDQALFTSSHVKAKDIKMGSTDWDNVYPTSPEEIDRMEDLIQQAQASADAPNDEQFNERIRDLKEVVHYSRKRHRTWKLALIAGSILGACIFWYFSNQDQESAQNRQKDVKIVELWQKADTTIAYQKMDTVLWERNLNYNERLNGANAYKAYYLTDYNQRAESSRLNSAKYKQQADTASTDERKKAYLKSSEKEQEDYEKYKKRFEEFAAKDFKAVKELALKDTQGAVDSMKSSSNTKRAWMIYLIILIPLYIISGYPRGYILSRHRRQASLMRGLQKWGFRLAAFFFGVGLAMQLLPDDIVKYRYSNGYTETRREVNPANFIYIVMKIGLMVVGVFIFCFISVFIMTFETVTGLIRNFNWQEILSKKTQPQS